MRGAAVPAVREGVEAVEAVPTVAQRGAAVRAAAACGYAMVRCGVAALAAALLAGALTGCGSPVSGGTPADDLSLSEAAQEAAVGESPAESPDVAPAEESTQEEAPAAAAASPSASQQKEDGAAMAVTENTTLTDLASNPAFGGWGRALLPWHGQRKDGATIGGESSLLPYHSNVQPAQATSALNRLIDDANAGEQVAYPVCDEAAIAADPDKADAVLFYFRGDPSAPFAIVNPGGGFAYVGSLHESLPHAQWLSEQGINAFSLSYREGSGQWAVEDLAQALTFIFEHADELGLSTEGYSLWGSSAGARMAAAIGSYGTAAFGGADLPRPAAVIMAYTGQSDYTADDPATYAVVGDRDGIAPSSIMEQRIRGLQRAGVPADIVVFPGLSHGFGTGEGTAAQGWMQGALNFWLEHR